MSEAVERQTRVLRAEGRGEVQTAMTRGRALRRAWRGRAARWGVIMLGLVGGAATGEVSAVRSGDGKMEQMRARGVARATMPVATYSIVARDPETGELGVAVQSHYFSVGPIVPWVRAGVGAVATQSLVDVSYGPLGLELMAGGKSAPEALAALLAADEQREVRQVAMVDASGRVAVHTGERCIAHAGHVVGEQFSVQANMMLRDSVPKAMYDAYREARGDLADRLLAALQAAEREGGDIRGKQSAAIVVVTGQPTGQVWRDRLFDLRVEDHPEPLEELARLMRLQRAYRWVDIGDQRVAAGDLKGAREAYERAAQLAPEVTELRFWQAVSLFSAGYEAEAMPVFAEIFRREPQWALLVPRLVRPGFLPNEESAERILEAAPQRPNE